MHLRIIYSLLPLLLILSITAFAVTFCRVFFIDDRFLVYGMSGYLKSSGILKSQGVGNAFNPSSSWSFSASC